MLHNKIFLAEEKFSDCIFTSDGGDTVLPAKVLDVSIRPEENVVRLLLGTVEGKQVDNPIFGKYVEFNTEYTGQYVELNTATGEITFEGLAPDFMDNETFDATSIKNALGFEMEAIKVSNPAVYGMFTRQPKNSSSFYPLPIIAKNLMKLLQNVGVLEKLEKTSGYDFVMKNICDAKFKLNDGKKLKKVMGIPPEVQSFIKSQRLNDMFPYFQSLTGDNPNDVKALIEYFQVMKKVHKLDRWQMTQFIKKLSSFFTGANGLSLRQILNHLIRENWFYGELGIPVNELNEWADCVDMAAAAGIECDRYPKNIAKYHRILAKNVDILKRPRKDEFAEAVSLYSRLTKEMAKYGYLIRPPKDEEELVKEGNMLHHCVANYRDKIIDEKCIVLFVRSLDEPDVPLYTVELEYTPGDTNFYVGQFKKIYDADVVEPELLKMLNEYVALCKPLIAGGKTLFVKPRTFKAKKDDNVAASDNDATD